MIKSGCKYFNYDFPCAQRKQKGGDCSGCRVYIEKENPILVIKLGATGDVLRTTAVLPLLKKRHKAKKIFWLSDISSAPVLENNPFLDRVFTVNSRDLAELSSYKFAAVYCLELSAFPLRFAGALETKKRYGFRLEPGSDRIRFYNSWGKYLYKISQDDVKKKRNQWTMQRLLCFASGFAGPIPEMSVGKDFFRNPFSATLGKKKIFRKKNIVGIIPGSGKRWITKRWGEKNFIRLLQLLDDTDNAFVVFFGGEDGALRNRFEKLKLKKSPVLFLDTSHSLKDYFSSLNLCDIIVTGDTLAMHAGILLKKKVFAVFGPTSSAEIEGYGRLVKLQSDEPCLVCYRRECPDMTCMKNLKPETLSTALKPFLN